MANAGKEHTSIRVHAPPGGYSNNIFGPPEPDQSAANKKKNTESDIFGNKKDHNEPAPQKSNRPAGNNIFGTDPEPPPAKSHAHGDKNKSTVFEETAPAPTHSDETTTKPSTIAGQYKQSQMKSSIFGNDEPTAARHVSDKNRSNIFGTNEQDEQQKRHTGVRQGLRDPNASRMGYNPINGEAYAPKENVNQTSDKQAESNVKATEPSNENSQAHANTSSENANPQVTNEKTINAQDQTTNNGNNQQKPVHTSVRVFHPPGGRSNGPLW